MATPLYDLAYASARHQRLQPRTIFHHGLWWERFFDAYPADFSAPKEAKARFVSELTGLCGNVDQLNASTARLRAIVEANGGQTPIYQLDWHFVTGMGIEHPTENGFTWHRTLGTPYLPGSSVKGLVRGYLEWLHEIKPDESTPSDIENFFIQWFGSPHKDPRRWPENIDSRAGWFVFFDALPIGPVILAADVMTPHMGDWYEKGGSIDMVADEPNPAIVPADWHSPNPVVFLIVKKASFQFGVAIRENLPDTEREKAKAALGDVMEKLEEALQWTGAGAKTAVGYGRMNPDDKANKEMERKRRDEALEKMGPRDRLIARIAEWPEAKLAERFGINISKTHEEFGEDFELLLELVRELRQEDIAGWQSATKKTDKLRWKAHRNLTGKGEERDEHPVP